MRFMASVVVHPPENPQELRELAPAEKERVGELLKSGALEAVYLGASRLRAWLIVKADSAEAAQATLATLPLYRFMEIDLVPLAEQG